MIRAENITVQRLGRPVLQEVSVTLQAGECLSVIGPNGAGKSTLLAALAALLPVQSGRVLFNDRDAHRMPRRELARQVAFVAQVHDGYLGFRVREVLEAARYPHVEPLSPLSEDDHLAVRNAVAACRITELLDRSMDTLSGGERQKVWIAAALAQQTPILLLDEPTNNLDPAHQVELARIMHELSRAGRTLVVVCHDLNLPLALGGRVASLRGGRIVFDEPVASLLETDRIAALFGTDFVVHHDSEGRPACVHVQWGGR